MAIEVVKYLVLCIIILFVYDFLVKVFTCLKAIFKSKCTEFKLHQEAKKYITQKTEQEEFSPINKYYGLFEFYLDSCGDEQNVKKEYCSIIKNKIKSKYKDYNICINATDKIFFNCTDFSIFDELVNDFVELYKYLADINKKRFIKTNLKFSIWAESGNISLKKAYCALSEMNNLNFVNQVIVNDGIYKKYQKTNLKGMDFCPYGIIESINEDRSYELFRLLKMLVPESNNK